MKKLLFLLLLTLPAAAQDPGTGENSPGGPQQQAPADPTGVPIDGGASLLLAGGVAYGLRRLRQRHRA